MWFCNFRYSDHSSRSSATISCDNCESTPGGSRIVCRDCHGEDTFDLCSEPKCVDSTATFNGTDRKTHTPNHGMFKVHRFIFNRDLRKIESAAKDALSSARETLSELEEEKKPMPGCVQCKTTISLPCWFCVDCTGERERNIWY